MLQYYCCNDRKKVGEEKIYLAYTSCYSPSLKEVRTGTQGGQELEAGVDTEGAMEECFLLTCPS